MKIQAKGWMSHVVREKSQAVREALKKWNYEIYGVMKAKIPSLVTRIQDLEVVGEVHDLSEEEKLEWKNNCEHLWGLLKSKDRLEY
jgi:hypothetical protein